MDRTACTELQCLYKGALYLTLPFTVLTDGNTLCRINNQNYVHKFIQNYFTIKKSTFFLINVLHVSALSEYHQVYKNI
jgi:hypothetical protein